MKVLGDLYNSIFHDPIQSNIYVEHQIWSKIKANLPDDYKIPDKKMMNILAKFIAEQQSSNAKKP